MEPLGSWLGGYDVNLTPGVATPPVGLTGMMVTARVHAAARATIALAANALAAVVSDLHLGEISSRQAHSCAGLLSE